MFQGVWQKLVGMVRGSTAQDLGLQDGSIIDFREGLRLPAREGLALSITPDLTLGGACMAVPAGFLPNTSYWRVAAQIDGAPPIEVSLQNSDRLELLRVLESQVEQNGKVTEIPLPNLMPWLGRGDSR